MDNKEKIFLDYFTKAYAKEMGITNRVKGLDQFFELEKSYS